MYPHSNSKPTVQQKDRIQDPCETFFRSQKRLHQAEEKQPEMSTNTHLIGQRRKAQSNVGAEQSITLTTPAAATMCTKEI